MNGGSAEKSKFGHAFLRCGTRNQALMRKDVPKINSGSIQTDVIAVQTSLAVPDVFESVLCMLQADVIRSLLDEVFRPA